MTLALRPEKIEVSLQPRPELPNRLSGMVRTVALSRRGLELRGRIAERQDAARDISQRRARGLRPEAAGDAVWLGFAAEARVVLPS